MTLEDRRAALFQLAQVAQALLQLAQLGVVEAAGDFLAVAGDERHRGALVEQRDGGGDLRRPRADIGGDALFDGRHFVRDWKKGPASEAGNPGL